MNQKGKKKFVCPYCDKVFNRGSMGYGNHLKAAHRSEYNYGRFNYTALPASQWPLIEFTNQKILSHAEDVFDERRAMETLADIGNQLNLDTVELGLSREDFAGFLKGSLIVAVIQSDMESVRFYSERLLSLEAGQ